MVDRSIMLFAYVCTIQVSPFVTMYKNKNKDKDIKKKLSYAK